MPGNVNSIDEDERIVEIEIERLRPFRSHPFKVKDDQEMKDLIDSISRYGILTPLVVRPLPEGVYEIISGHRRKHAAEQLGFRKLPVIIRVLTDEDAVVSMVDSNMHREKVLPSEKAFAYKMKYEAMKQKSGRRKGSRPGHSIKGKKTVQIMGEEAGESPKQLQRYLKIAELIPELMQMLDKGEISFNPAYESALMLDKGEISFNPAYESAFLKVEEQEELVRAIHFVHSTPSISQAQRMKKMSKEGTLTAEQMRSILSEVKKGEINRVVFKNEQLYQFFPKEQTASQIKLEILEILKLWKAQSQVNAGQKPVKAKRGRPAGRKSKAKDQNTGGKNNG